MIKGEVLKYIVVEKQKKTLYDAMKNLLVIKIFNRGAWRIIQPLIGLEYKSLYET
jgi:hypothetical protein